MSEDIRLDGADIKTVGAVHQCKELSARRRLPQQRMNYLGAA
jgi:hypothetical protein